MTKTTNGDGLRPLEAEMARQHADARASLAGAGAIVDRIARSVSATGRLVLTGMGASHFGNRVAEAALRTAGIDATAIVASELLAAPTVPVRRTLLLVSQSGESGEVVAYLDQADAAGDEFGLTLSPEGRLAAARPSLIGAGGVERAFAATRSLFVQLALLAELCRVLGVRTGPIDAALEAGPAAALPGLDGAMDRLAAARAFVVSGRGLFQGLAEAASLTLMELGRVPVLSLEGGQFRHGPLEILTGRTGVVLLRTAGTDGERSGDLARTVVEAGAPVVVLDASGAAPVEGAVTVPCPIGADFTAMLGMLPVLQRLTIGLAGAFVEDVGVPVRSSKVTRDL